MIGSITAPDTALEAGNIVRCPVWKSTGGKHIEPTIYEMRRLPMGTGGSVREIGSNAATRKTISAGASLVKRSISSEIVRYRLDFSSAIITDIGSSDQI
jgi:hypothetical protein